MYIYNMYKSDVKPTENLLNTYSVCRFSDSGVGILTLNVILCNAHILGI